MSMSLLRYVLAAALRDRLIVVMLLALVLGASLSLFLGSAALIEKSQFSQVFAAGGLRITGAICLILFVVSHIRRSFENRDIDYLLSRPIGRVVFITSYAGAFSFLAVLIAFFTTLVILSTKMALPGKAEFLWFISLSAEYVMMVNVALFFSMVLSGVASSVMASLGLYVLARLIGQLLGIVASGVSFPGAALLSFLMQVISILVPRLDLMAQSSWLVYGLDSSVGFSFVLLQMAVFSALVILAAAVDLVRRQF